MNRDLRACEGAPHCMNDGPRRDCGHYACDSCTDDESSRCLWCAPVGDERAPIEEEMRVD